jgi:phage terminase large subunit
MGRATATTPTPYEQAILAHAIRRGVPLLSRREQAKREAKWALYAGDVVRWLHDCGKTYDPRLPGEKLIRFRPFPRQIELLRWLEAREEAQEDGLIEKSREMGVTWLCVAFAVHRWLFRQRYSAGFGSRKLDLVDKIGDPDSILEKARILIRNLPRWLLPEGYDESKHAAWCKITNPANGSIIKGEGGDQIGRGGRTSIYFVDEFAYLERADSVVRALSRTTDCRIWGSTPNGPAGPFYQMRHAGQVPVFTFHWRDDPRRSQEWYEEQCRRLDPVTIAQELDIDYSASVSGILIPAAWVRAAQGHVLRWLDGAPYEPRGPRIAGLDIGEASNTLVIRQGPCVLSVEQWSGDLASALWRAVTLAEEAGCDALHYDSAGPGADVPDVLQRSERVPRLRVVGINGGAAPSDAICEDGRRASEVYANLRAEAHWRLRRRFRLTWESREGGAQHPPDEQITLPADPQLAVECSVPLMETRETGKLAVESKVRMAARGVASPHRLDALALTEAPVPVPASPGGAGARIAGPRF